MRVGHGPLLEMAVWRRPSASGCNGAEQRVLSSIDAAEDVNQRVTLTRCCLQEIDRSDSRYAAAFAITDRSPGQQACGRAPRATTSRR